MKSSAGTQINAAMERRLSIFHGAATFQLAGSAALVIFWTLKDAGFNYLALFSLSVQGVMVVGLGVLVYGFAAFRGAVGRRTSVEFPLTGSYPYRTYYLVTPVLGGFMSGIDYLLAEGLVEGLRGLALGTVITAFVVWVVTDPIIGIIESLLPASRRRRSQRRALQVAAREERTRRNRDLLSRLREDKQARLSALEPVLARHRDRLVRILEDSRWDADAGIEAGATIGFELWRLDGIDCMKEMYSSIVQSCGRSADGYPASHLEYWWDGIGEWRQESTMPRT